MFDSFIIRVLKNHYNIRRPLSSVARLVKRERLFGDLPRSHNKSRLVEKKKKKRHDKFVLVPRRINLRVRPVFYYVYKMIYVRGARLNETVFLSVLDSDRRGMVFFFLIIFPLHAYCLIFFFFTIN